MTAFAGLRCIRCGREFDDGPASLAGCPACATEKSRSNGTCVYDYDALKGRFPHEAVAAGQRGLWRWDALLPVSRRAAVTLGEGDTPLLRCDGLARAWGLKELYVKDETRNPTWSYKDRLCSVAISVARQKGARVIVVSSTGNHGAAAAAYAARAGLRCVVLTTVSVPTTMKTLMQSYGAAVVALPTLEDRWAVMAQAAQRFGWFPVSNGFYPPVGSVPYGIEGYKTIAFEIAEQFDWQVPDFVIVPTAFGDGLYGTWKGFWELRRLGVTQAAPRMVAAEPFGPLAAALERGLEEGEPVPGGQTVAFSIGGTHSTHQALAALKESDGLAVTADDDAIMWAQAELARHEGLYVEASSACALAALHNGLQAGRIDPGSRIVAVLTSSGLKDPAATARRLPPVPESGPALDQVMEVLRETYGFDAEGA